MVANLGVHGRDHRVQDAFLTPLHRGHDPPSQPWTNQGRERCYPQLAGFSQKDPRAHPSASRLETRGNAGRRVGKISRSVFEDASARCSHGHPLFDTCTMHVFEVSGGDLRLSSFIFSFFLRSARMFCSRTLRQKSQRRDVAYSGFGDLHGASTRSSHPYRKT